MPSAVIQPTTANFAEGASARLATADNIRSVRVSRRVESVQLAQLLIEREWSSRSECPRPISVPPADVPPRPRVDRGPPDHRVRVLAVARDPPATHRDQHQEARPPLRPLREVPVAVAGQSRSAQPQIRQTFKNFWVCIRLVTQGPESRIPPVDNCATAPRGRRQDRVRSNDQNLWMALGEVA